MCLGIGALLERPSFAPNPCGVQAPLDASRARRRNGLMNRRTLLASLAALPAPALAQGFPTRPIRILVGFAAGGSTDVFARSMAPRLQALLGQPVVVENRPGAGGNIATEATARSAPDGYTLLLGTIGPLAINPTLYGNLSFDPLTDLTAITLVGEVPIVLAVPNARRVSLIPEVPTVAESGLPGFDGMDWAALMGPRNLPAPILAQLNQAATTVLREPELVQNMAGRRLVLMPTTPGEAAAFLRAETARWAPVIRASGARPD
jgi:tripartite-type tricarboxylate transporter receptor subunit TctC